MFLQTLHCDKLIFPKENTLKRIPNWPSTQSNAARAQTEQTYREERCSH